MRAAQLAGLIPVASSWRGPLLVRKLRCAKVGTKFEPVMRAFVPMRVHCDRAGVRIYAEFERSGQCRRRVPCVM